MDSLINFFTEVGKLKFIKRRWSVRGVSEKDSESAADHAFRLAIMSWFFADGDGLDTAKLIKMALIHDLCNVYTGEISPYDKLLTGDRKKDKTILSQLPRYPKKEKEKLVKEKRLMEKAALNKLLSFAPKETAKEVKELWLDYEEMRTPEGHFLRQVDRIEPLVQAVEYKKQGKLTSNLNVYWYQAKEWLDNKKLQEFLEALDNYVYNNKSKTKVAKKVKAVSRQKIS